MSPDLTRPGLKPLQTLKHRGEFLGLRKAARFSCGQFALQGKLVAVDEGTPDELPVIGYTVTKKTGNSVERSRIKRRLRMAVAKAVGQYPGSIKGEMVVVARRSAISEPFDLLVANLTKGIDHLLAKGKKAH